MDKKPFIERLKKEVPELKKAGWSKTEIDTLLKHFSFSGILRTLILTSSISEGDIIFFFFLVLPLLLQFLYHFFQYT